MVSVVVVVVVFLSIKRFSCVRAHTGTERSKGFKNCIPGLEKSWNFQFLQKSVLS